MANPSHNVFQVRYMINFTISVLPYVLSSRLDKIVTISQPSNISCALRCGDGQGQRQQPAIKGAR
jgi:hypothetical protein